jgi:hypothetical protein
MLPPSSGCDSVQLCGRLPPFRRTMLFQDSFWYNESMSDKVTLGYSLVSPELMSVVLGTVSAPIIRGPPIVAKASSLTKRSLMPSRHRKPAKETKTFWVRPCVTFRNKIVFTLRSC